MQIMNLAHVARKIAHEQSPQAAAAVREFCEGTVAHRHYAGLRSSDFGDDLTLCLGAQFRHFSTDRGFSCQIAQIAG